MATSVYTSLLIKDYKRKHGDVALGIQRVDEEAVGGVDVQTP